MWETVVQIREGLESNIVIQEREICVSQKIVKL